MIKWRILVPFKYSKYSKYLVVSLFNKRLVFVCVFVVTIKSRVTIKNLYSYYEILRFYFRSNTWFWDCCLIMFLRSKRSREFIYSSYCKLILSHIYYVVMRWSKHQKKIWRGIQGSEVGKQADFTEGMKRKGRIGRDGRVQEERG